MPLVNSLTPQQCRVLALIENRGEVGNADVRELLGCASRTAGLYLWHLAKAGKICCDGLGQGARWRLADGLERPRVRDVVGKPVRSVFEWRP